MVLVNKITVKDFAEQLGVPRRTLYRWIEKGMVIPKKGFNGRPYFTWEDVKQFKERIENELSGN